MGAYNEAALAELSWRSFQMAERQANNQGGLDAVAQLFSKPENLGVPLQQFIESAESLLKENDLKAVTKGQWEEIRKATEEYTRCKIITDRMMETSRKVTDLPTYPGNVNSTRPLGNGRLNGMPTEYLEEFAVHSRVNGVFSLFALSKNIGIPLKSFLDDPAGILQDLVKDFRDTRLLSAHKDKPLGARLALSFDRDLNKAASTDWNFQIAPIARGLEGIGAMMPDQASRTKVEGQNYCAVASAYYEYGKEMTPWDNLSKAFQKVCSRLLSYAPEEKRAELREAILAGQIKHNPELKQNRAVLARELEPALKKIMEQPAFKQMVKNEGLKGLTDKLIQGPAALTDAYKKAILQAENPQAKGEAPKATAEQMKEFWTNHQVPVQGLGPRQ